jgi:hypothetical protein
MIHMQNDVNASYIQLPIHLVFFGYVIITSEYKNLLHKMYVMPSIREPQQLHIYIQGVTGVTDQTSGGCSLC